MNNFPIRMENLKQILSRSISAALFTAVMAGTWDAWWHGALGRESFFSPPHILLYLSVFVAISFGVYGWYKTKEKLWKRLAFILAIVPFSAPFDEIWHRVFGIESVSSPLIVWSPPHVALILSIVGSLVMLLPILKDDKDAIAQRLFGGLAFASIFSLLLFLVSPLEPLGPYHLLGFWGAGITAGLFGIVLLFAKKWLPGIGGATIFIAFFCMLSSIGFGEKIALGVTVPPHDHPPSWLQMFALILPAVAVDLVKFKYSWLQGAIAASLYGIILYSFASAFLEPAFQYGPVSAITAIFSSLIVGIISTLAVTYIETKNI